MDKRPFLSFFVALGILVALIVISNILGAPKKAEEKTVVQVKPVHVYSIGSAPTMSVQAQVRKSGVIKITALTGGVVQSIYKQEGETDLSELQEDVTKKQLDLQEKQLDLGKEAAEIQEKEDKRPSK